MAPILGRSWATNDIGWAAWKGREGGASQVGLERRQGFSPRHRKIDFFSNFEIFI
jgi:hypothetical protein